MGPKLVITSIIITAVVFAVAWMGDQTGSTLCLLYTSDAADE